MSDNKIKMLGIDIGGGSGRGLIGSFDGEKLPIEEICRFEAGTEENCAPGSGRTPA